jgi:hypothetical protein
MHFLRAHAGTHIHPSQLVAAAELETRPCGEGNGPLPRPRTEADSLILRASVPLASTAAFAGLARQPKLGVPAKVAWSGKGGFELVAEVPREGSLRDAEEGVRAVLDDALAWFANGLGAGTNGTSAPSAPLVDVLEGAGCFVRPGGAGACFVDANLGGTSYRALVGERPDARVQVSLPATTLRVEGECPLHAAAIFALEANYRLRLARVGTTLLTSDRLRVVWDVVVNGGPCLSRRFPDALEALVVAREETLRALRMLCSHDVAAAYLGSHPRRQAAQQESEQK